MTQTVPKPIKYLFIALVASFVLYEVAKPYPAQSTTQETSAPAAETWQDRNREGLHHAEDLCAKIEDMGIAPQCEVSGFHDTMSMYKDVSTQGAEIICQQIVQITSQKGWRFGDFQLKIFSPFSGDHPLAVCKLPS